MKHTNIALKNIKIGKKSLENPKTANSCCRPTIDCCIIAFLQGNDAKIQIPPKLNNQNSAECGKKHTFR
jgi:hypothetical protein